MYTLINNKEWVKKRLKLEEVKKTGFLLPLYTFVRIWSDEHKMWWRWKGEGYSRKRIDAGVWTFVNAYEQVKHCNKDKKILFEIIDAKEIIMRIHPIAHKNLSSNDGKALDLFIESKGKEW